MKNLLFKELRLSASPLSYAFIAAAVLVFAPGYPILVAAFFVTLGIFYTFTASRENNDIGFSLLLPVAKSDIVLGKYLFCIFIEVCGFIAISAVTLLRMTVLNNVTAYTANALMNANFVFLGYVLLLFGIFNLVFVGGFFKTAYYFAKPFIAYSVSATVLVVISEVLHHIPQLEMLGTGGFENIGLQLAFLSGGLVLFVLLTYSGYKKSKKRFLRADL